MLPAPQPFTRAQESLATHWQALLAAPKVRLCRWLTSEADRPLLHDYLLELSTGPEAPLHRLKDAPRGDWAPWLASQPRDSITWLEALGPETEHTLRLYLAERHPQRLLVLEDQATQPLQRLTRWFPAEVQSCTPAVSMQQLLAELSRAAPEDQLPGRFQQQFQQLTQAIASANSPGVAAHAAACLATAALLPGAGAVVTVWLASGQYFLAQKQPDEALRHFAAALAKTEAAFESGDTAAGLLSVQVWLHEAAAWQQRRRRSAVLAALQQAVNRAAALPASLLGVEVARQLGLALEQDGQIRSALTSYEQGVGFAEQLPAGQRPAATIQALGDAYTKCLRTPPDQKALRRRLATLID